MHQILSSVRTFEGVLELAPTAGSPYPELAWGDHFFYYAPDGTVPRREQPYATIVTKDYPDDTTSALDPPGRWRLNIHVGRRRFAELIGSEPADALAVDASAADRILPHPVYGSLGWVCVVNPEQTVPVIVPLLQHAHQDARERALRRRSDPGDRDGGGSEPR
ncbi:hypothetical protein SAMN04488554_2454 [Ruania alba]|uniref:DUF6194 domain-containing protein n=2 Tax=Ruania alba TaxID=648782 RepID=A0A1H5KWP4_9MICO|nr:hypothetical protein SAMN04488554_2454 [Ruania alba]